MSVMVRRLPKANDTINKRFVLNVVACFLKYILKMNYNWNCNKPAPIAVICPLGFLDKFSVSRFFFF